MYCINVCVNTALNCDATHKVTPEMRNRTTSFLRQFPCLVSFSLGSMQKSQGRNKNLDPHQGILAEGKGSVRLTSLLR
jgi:hypothetical protein